MSEERTWTPDEIAAHRYEMKEALDGGLISRREYDGQMSLMDEAEDQNRQPSGLRTRKRCGIAAIRENAAGCSQSF